jgi:hypothetical protein
MPSFIVLDVAWFRNGLLRGFLGIVKSYQKEAGVERYIHLTSSISYKGRGGAEAWHCGLVANPSSNFLG